MIFVLIYVKIIIIHKDHNKTFQITRKNIK